MIEPAITDLMKRVDSRYTLVVAVARRARRLADGEPKLVDCDSDKSVTVATYEIAEDKITYERNENKKIVEDHNITESNDIIIEED